MPTPIPAHQHREKLSILRLVATLSSFMAIAFVLCVVAGYVLPGMRGFMPVSAFPGFSWSNPRTATLGTLWSMGVGAYVAVLFGVLYNFFDGLGRKL